MSIGFYDLYKHLPVFSNFIGDYLTDWSDCLEEMIYVRMTILIGYIVYFTGPFSAIFDFFIGSSATWSVINYMLYPVYSVTWCIKSIFTLTLEMLLPIWALVALIIRAGWHLIWCILSLPFVGVYTVFTLIYDFFYYILICVKVAASSLQGMFSFFRPVANPQNRQATLSAL